jgi:hypothetical protein
VILSKFAMAKKTTGVHQQDACVLSVHTSGERTA